MYKTRGSIDRRVGKNDRARRGGSITRARSATAAAPRSRFRRPDAAPRAIYPRSRSSRGAPCARRISTPGSARCPWASGICPAFGRRRQSPRASSTNHSFIIHHSSSIINHRASSCPVAIDRAPLPAERRRARVFRFPRRRVVRAIAQRHRVETRRERRRRSRARVVGVGGVGVGVARRRRRFGRHGDGRARVVGVARGRGRGHGVDVCGE